VFDASYKGGDGKEFSSHTPATFVTIRMIDVSGIREISGSVLGEMAR